MEDEEIHGVSEAGAARTRTVRVRVTGLGHGIIHTGETGPHRATTFSEGDELDCPEENVEVYEQRGWIVRSRLDAASRTHVPATRTPAPPEPHDREAVHRLSLRAKRDEKTGCLVWQGSKQNGGYGQITYRRRLQTTHRLSWVAHYGPVPEGNYVCHACDNPACVAIEHLFLGTPSANYRDMRAKGRTRFNAKLDVAEVMTIKKRLAAGEMASRIARDYAVKPDQILAIKNGHAWREISARE